MLCFSIAYAAMNFSLVPVVPACLFSIAYAAMN